MVAETPPPDTSQPGSPLGSESAVEAEPESESEPVPEPTPRPAPEPEPDVYEVDLPDDMRHVDVVSAAAPDPPTVGATPAKCPSCNGRLRAGAVICMNCGFNLADGGKIETRIETDPSPKRGANRASRRPHPPPPPRARPISMTSA